MALALRAGVMGWVRFHSKRRINAGISSQHQQAAVLRAGHFNEWKCVRCVCVDIVCGTITQNETHVKRQNFPENLWAFQYTVGRESERKVRVGAPAWIKRM